MPIATRKDDKAALDWVKLRAAGSTTHKIAADAEVRETQVRTATNRIMNADLDESGERAKAVRKAYWPALKPSRKKVAK